MTPPNSEKRTLLGAGIMVMQHFCQLNSIQPPAVAEAESNRWAFGVCAYYRANVMTICVSRCASVGTAGMQWSYPGNTVDRTPYGVVQHELGHHVDTLKSTRVDRYRGDFSVSMRERSGEVPLTSYCPDDAEMFRLFVTNPDLLKHLRPRTHAEMAAHFKPVFTDGWREMLAGAPDRTIIAAERKIAKGVKVK